MIPADFIFNAGYFMWKLNPVNFIASANQITQI